MKYLTVLCFVLTLSTINAFEADYEHYDIDAFVKDTEAVRARVECFLEREPCDEVGAAYKEDVQVIMETGCAGCSPRKKYVVHRFIEVVETKFPLLALAMKQKYDPLGIHFLRLVSSVAGALVNGVTGTVHSLLNIL